MIDGDPRCTLKLPGAVSFTIPGRLGGWQRTGTNIKQRFTPAAMRSDKGVVGWTAKQAMGTRTPIEGPVTLLIYIERTYPQSWSAKKCAAKKYITGKPDASNQLKLIEDAMNTIVFKDDSQIATLTVVRMYGPHDRIFISVTPLEG
jgi:Holliday junction resolvase RusA-like endonuclease